MIVRLWPDTPPGRSSPDGPEAAGRVLETRGTKATGAPSHYSRVFLAASAGNCGNRATQKARTAPRMPLSAAQPTFNGAASNLRVQCVWSKTAAERYSQVTFLLGKLGCSHDVLGGAYPAISVLVTSPLARERH
jgi:hypothetical protein